MSINSGENKVILDKSVLKELKLIMEDEFTEVLQVFLEESVSLMSDIHEDIEEAPENVVKKIHTLKSCSNNVGAIQLSGVAEEIKHFLIQDDVASAKSKLNELQDVFAQSHAQVRKYMKENIDKVA